MCFAFGGCGHAQHFVVVEIALLDSTVFDVEVVEDRSGEAEDNPWFDPCLDIVRCRDIGAASELEINDVTRRIVPCNLKATAFADHGEVIEKDGADSFPINSGKCIRFHDLANIDFTGPSARPIISLLSAEPYVLPLTLRMVERHPLGSQAFYPLSGNPFLVIVCDDENGTPVNPRAFVTAPGQGVNIRRGVWHGVLTPLGEQSDFIVVDRGGEGDNLQEHVFDEPYVIEPPA